MEQLLQAIADDWHLLRTLRRRLPQRVAQARRDGIAGRHIARVTKVPERNVRRWTERADRDLSATEGEAAA